MEMFKYFLSNFWVTEEIKTEFIEIISEMDKGIKAIV